MRWALCGRPHWTQRRVNDATAVTFSVKCFNPLKLYPVRKHLQKAVCFIFFKFIHDQLTVNLIAVTAVLLMSSAILNFMGPMMGSLKSPCTTSHRSSVRRHALNRVSLYAFWRQTKKRTDRLDGQAQRIKPPSLSLNNQLSTSMFWTLFSIVFYGWKTWRFRYFC